MADDYKDVVQVSSDVLKQCLICNGIKFSDPTPDVSEQINHYLKHGYKLLHVGQQTTRNSEGKLWETTVAILGK